MLLKAEGVLFSRESVWRNWRWRNVGCGETVGNAVEEWGLGPGAGLRKNVDRGSWTAEVGTCVASGVLRPICSSSSSCRFCNLAISAS